MLYKLVRWSRQLRAFFGGLQERKEDWYLFSLTGHLSVSEIRKRLIPLGHQYNPFSTTYRGQVWTSRRLVPDGLHQIHLRFYYLDDLTVVTGHYEIDPLLYPAGHIRGEDLRALTHEERLNIQWAFYQGE